MIAALLFLFSTHAFAGTATAVSVSTSTTVSTSSTTNRATNWVATKTDTAMIMNVQVDPYNVDQASSFSLQSNSLYDCVGTNLNGRTDAICLANPNDPECVGLTKAMTKATTCVLPTNLKPGQVCLQYGSDGYTMEEWVAFGTQYQSSMQTCFTTKQQADSIQVVTTSNGTAMPLMQSLTEPGSLVAVGNSAGTSTLVSSGISGSASTDTSTGASTSPGSGVAAVASTAKSILSMDDGSAALGYDQGTIVQSSSDGKAFYTVVMDSPFAESLQGQNKVSLEHGLSEASLVVDQVKTSGRLADLTADAGDAKVADATPPTPAPSAVPKSSNASLVDVPAADPVAQAEAQAKAQAIFSEQQAKDMAKSAPALVEAGSHKLFLAERIAMLQAAALNKMEGVKGGRSLASLSIYGKKDSAAAINNDETLFHRVSSAYQRHVGVIQHAAPGIKSGLETAEKPAFFKSL